MKRLWSLQRTGQSWILTNLVSKSDLVAAKANNMKAFLLNVYCKHIYLYIILL